jgi:hypothetical protein
VSLPATVGFNYASFFLGGVNNGQTAVRSVTHMGSHTLSGFAQDTWKVTRKLTLDYGLRYDFGTYLRDGNGYYGVFGPNTANPSAGGRLGAVVYDGYKPGRCQCDLAHNYPYAWGPRLGVAYQITSKTVIRAGLGISYNKSDDNNFGLLRSSSCTARRRTETRLLHAGWPAVQDQVPISIEAVSASGHHNGHWAAYGPARRPARPSGSVGSASAG